ncbi:MAG: TetR/AcrR family transcriptional regulator [Parvibaculum sp.]
MARPRKSDPDQLAEDIMNAFWRDGFGHTSIPDLTEATGHLRGSLYAAHEDKDGMFAVALERYLNQLRDDILPQKPGLDGLRFILNTVVLITTGDPQRRGCLLINAIPELPSLNDRNRNTIETALKEMQALIRGKIREAGGELPQTPDPKTLSRLTSLVFAASVSIRVLGRAGSSRKMLQEIADGAIDAVVGALAPKK